MKQLSAFTSGLTLLYRYRTLGSLALLLSLVLPAAQAQNVAFPRSADFTGTDPKGFILGNAAFLTAAGGSSSGGTPIDAVGSGTLRLTNNTGGSGYIIDNSTFSSSTGFNISFEFFAYGTTSASPGDGFSVFLVDGDGTTPGSGFAIGAGGGSLGYAYHTNPYGQATSPGVTKGYLGIGIDEYGNYGAPTEGKSGGYPGTSNSILLPNAVSLRGSYNSADAQRFSGYSYIAGSGSLSFPLAVGTSSSNPGSRITTPSNAGYRKAYINVVPVTTGGTAKYRVTVRIQYGQQVVTTINNVEVANPPSSLRIGFAGSSGGNNSIHEIRALTVAQAPIAIDDNAQTKYNTPITIGVLDNDQTGGGADIDPTTVDLNQTTIGRDPSYSVSGKGTFTVDDSGVVTFTPVSGFAGTVSIPYSVRNVNGDLSNPATITVVVTGADVQTVVSGSTTVTPGTTGSYSVTTTNNGQETAINVIPTLTLPSGVTYVSSSGGTLSNGTVSFPQATLAAGESASNSVVVTFPTTGNYSLTSNYTYPSGAAVPDATASNNASTLTVAVNAAAPLPVQLTTFSAAAVGADVVLHWETAQELNNHYFAIECSLDGLAFASIGTVAGKGTTTQASTYRYVDAGASVRASDVLYYRLRQVDDTGKVSFSSVKVIRFQSSETGITLYPNPATSSATLDLRALPAGSYSVQVFEATGRLVHQAIYQPGPCPLPVQGLAVGTYFVKVQSANFHKVLSFSHQ